MANDGADYSFLPHPTPAQLKAAGIKFAGRYVSPNPANDTNGKNLLAAEWRGLQAAGIAVILFAEQWEERMLGGSAAGTADAQHFAAVTKTLGLDGIVMYAAADWAVTLRQQAPVNDYLDGMAAVLGRDRTGIYGGFWAVNRALTAGKARFAVQTYAWSAEAVGQPLPAHAEIWTVAGRRYYADTRANVRQGGTVTIGGAGCDRLYSQTLNFGQFPPPERPWQEWVTHGQRSLAEIAAVCRMTPAAVLRATANHYGFYDQVIRDHVNAVFTGTRGWDLHIPDGGRLWVQAP